MPAPGSADDSKTLRDLVRSSVERRIPIDHTERQSIEAFLTEYDRLADPFSEQLDPVHVTGSAIVVGPRGVILLKHKRLGLWLQPGGHIDAGETPWAAAAREAAEETGLKTVLSPADVDPATGRPQLVHVDVHPGGRGHTHLDLRYVVRVDSPGGHAEPAPPDGESPDVHWFGWAQAIERASDERLRALLGVLAASHPV
jgi:8-oxo-dGTP pyrophosphatase MutT (NUDIX family)